MKGSVMKQHVIDRTIEVMGTVDRANDWLDHVSATLGGTPRSVMETQEGADRVLLHLAGIERHHRT